MNIRLKFRHLFTKKLFQPHCLLYASHNGGELGFCEACLQDMPWHIAPQCPQCSLLSNGLTCGSCLNTSPYFDATHALFTYDFPVDNLLQHYKYRDMLHLANTFANLLIAKKLANHKRVKKIDLIIPMPMHPSR